jgi:hypothetical protein
LAKRLTSELKTQWDTNNHAYQSWMQKQNLCRKYNQVKNT